MVVWLFSFETDPSLKVRLVVNGEMCKPRIDYDPEETYCGNARFSLYCLRYVA